MIEIKIMVSETIALEIVEAVQCHATTWSQYDTESFAVKNWACRIADTLENIADQIEQQIADS